MIVKPSLIVKQVKKDLLPFDFRLATTWRIALLCALMAAIAMIYEIPESAISCYLIIYLIKADAVQNILLSVGVIILCSIVVCIIFVLFNLTIQNIILRFFFMALFSAVFMYLASASSLGDIGNLVALVIAFLMTLIDDIPVGDVATRALLYALLMAVSPMLLVILFNFFVGISPRKLLLNRIATRFSIASDFFLGRKESQLEISELLSTQTECKRYLMFIKMFYLRGREDIKWLENIIDNSYQILIMSLTFDKNTPTSIRFLLSKRCLEIADCFTHHQIDKIKDKQQAQYTISKIHLLNTFNKILSNKREIKPVQKKTPFFVSDAFTNPNHKYFALKTTIAAILCYIFYDYFKWQGIHTAMITCYVVALTSVGETVHKLTLRITGCLIGALIGMISLLYIIPNLSDVFELMVLIFFCLLPAAWVAVGNERISYAGVQVGLAFLLTTLHGFKPSFDMDVVSDRILGILLGNIVMYIIFTKVWPSSIVNTIYKQITSILDNYIDLRYSTNKNDMLILVSSVNEAITQSKDNINLLIFEKKDRERNKNLMLFFKESLNKISYISYHNYAHKFIFEYNLAYSNVDENSKYEFKKNILNEEMKILPADERELVFKHLIREKL
ncbi:MULTISPECIES: FUSC family protein [Proteus]|uniref:FUSC family protein n=2 Tax=Morganellaceae TaxID=1903414 RepID=UPI000BFE4869|nr:MULTISPECIES: FUSC family protein [Proteus]ATN00592.1 multidrug transporter [Proteus vulgaris]MBG2836214.1 FUSC family protein [Proteus terrae subsp. cibarius]MBG2867142.1 FUSC family protein [Proteus terrae subsp. cibarius]MDR9741025.1 FUSC family protein [Proteus terrae]